MKKVNSLGFRMPFVICSIVVLIIIVMLISSVNIASSGISKSRLGGFNSTIAGYASVLDTWFDLQTSLVSTYSVTPTVVKYLENDVNFTEELLSETINKFKDNNLYLINFGIADSEGDIFLDSLSSSALGKNLKDYIPNAWNRFVASNTDGVVYADKLVQSEITSKWSMPAIKPVKDSYNITIGYIYIFLDWYMLYQTHFSDIDLGKTGGLFITTDKLYNIMDSLYDNIAVMKINPVYQEAFNNNATNGIISYDVLDVSEFKHFRINHSEKFAEEKNHINGIENFWNQAKRHLRKFNGIPKEHFYLFIKECQFRFNNPKVDKQLEIIYNLAKKELF